MTEEAKKSRAEYFRKWRKANPGKNKEYCSRYWERKARQQKQEASAE